MLTGRLVIDKDKFYSIGETCEVLGMSRKTLRKYTKSGDIQATLHPASKKLRYKGAKIEQFFNQVI